MLASTFSLIAPFLGSGAAESLACALKSSPLPQAESSGKDSPAHPERPGALFSSSGLPKQGCYFCASASCLAPSTLKPITQGARLFAAAKSNQIQSQLSSGSDISSTSSTASGSLQTQLPFGRMEPPRAGWKERGFRGSHNHTELVLLGEVQRCDFGEGDYAGTSGLLAASTCYARKTQGLISQTQQFLTSCLINTLIV